MMYEDENQRKREVVFQKLKMSQHFHDVWDCLEKHEQVASQRQSDTCTWLFSTMEYRSWRNGDDKFLLLQGKAGAGKTVLASAVIEDLLKTKREGELSAYFYCDFRVWKSTSAHGVMLSILAQLVTDLCAAMSLNPEVLINDLFKMTDSTGSFTVNRFPCYLTKIATLYARRLLIVVDALDECNDVETLLNGLVRCKGDVRVFVTTRSLPLQDGIHALSHFGLIPEETVVEGLSKDISLYVERVFESRLKTRPFVRDIEDEIKAKLRAKPNDMFLWVKCQVGMLEERNFESVSDVRRVLESLPKGLEEIYEGILLMIEEEHEDSVWRVLEWLMIAQRPTRMDELLEMVRVNLDYRALDSRSALMKGADLLEACRGLVVHHKDIVTLSHMSVKDYLVKELSPGGDPQQRHIVMSGLHERLARVCMAYVVTCLSEMKGSSGQSPHVTREQTQEQDISTKFPLMEYVRSHGFSHLSHLGPDNRRVLEDVIVLQATIGQHTEGWNTMCSFAPSSSFLVSWPTSKHDIILYILLAFGSEALFRTHVHSTAFTPKEGTNPLVYAACLGKTEHARILISRGVDINLQGWITDDVEDRKATPLEVAVDNWHTEIVDLLLTSGCVVPDSLLARVLGEHPHNFPFYILSHLLQTPAFVKWARTTPWEIRGLLDALFNDAEDHDQVDGRGELLLASRRLIELGFGDAILLIAAEKGCISIIENLLPKDMSSTPDLLVSSHFRRLTEVNVDLARTLLLLAVERGCIPIVRALFPIEVPSAPGISDIMDAVDSDGDSLLHVAMKLPDEEQCLTIMEHLVHAGFNTCKRNNDYKLPVHVAVERGLILVVKYLLSQGVSFPPRILFAALRATPSKQAEMVHLLITAKADVGVLNPKREALLHVVMRSVDRSVRQEIAKILIDAGSDPLIHNSHGETPLSFIVKHEYQEIGNYLLLFCTASHLWSLLSSDPSSQTVALHSLLGDSLHFPPEEEGELLQVIRQFLDDENNHSAVDEKLAGAPGDHTNVVIAVRRGFRRVVERLPYQVPLPDQILFTALRHQVSMVSFLIRKGANLHAEEDNGNTVLRVSTSKLDETWCCTIMDDLSTDCPLHILTNAFRLLIDVAVRRRFISVVECMLSHSAQLPHNVLRQVLTRGPGERTPLEVAKRKGYNDVANRLRTLIPE